MSAVDHTTEIVCRELVELVTDYLEGALDEATRARVEAHLAICEHCTEYVEQMRITTRALRVTRTAELQPGRRDELLAMFREWAADGDGA
jgi:anti-sigma factor RsiW